MATRRRRTKDPAGDGWHVDRRINVSFLVVMGTQFALGVYAWAELKTDVKYVKENVESISTANKDVNKRLDVLTSLQTTMHFHTKSIETLESTLNSILEYEYRRRSRLNGRAQNNDEGSR